MPIFSRLVLIPFCSILYDSKHLSHSCVTYLQTIKDNFTSKSMNHSNYPNYTCKVAHSLTLFFEVSFIIIIIITIIINLYLNVTRRFAACTQAVVILRSTSYIAIGLNVMHLKLYEIQSNRCAYNKLFCFWFHFLESINSLLLVCTSLGREKSQGLYISL